MNGVWPGITTFLACLHGNLFDEGYEITGIGIAAPAYGPRRSFYGGLTAVF